MSTAYHPQTDGQVERLNRTVEEALRAYVNHRQDDWDELLTPIEFAINNSKQKSTGYSPFELTYGQSPLTPSIMLNQRAIDSRTPAANDFLEKMRALNQIAKQCLERAQNRQRTYADRRLTER